MIYIIKGFNDAAGHAQAREMILAEIHNIEGELARLKPYIPWDGKASTPGPWELWYNQIGGLNEVYAQLWKSKAQLLAALAKMSS